MKLNHEDYGDMRVIRVMEDRIDAACAIEFKEKVRNILREDIPRVILDLSAVSFIDSSGLGAVVAVRKLLGAQRNLELSCLSKTVARVFKLTRMDSVFIIHDALPLDLQNAM